MNRSSGTMQLCIEIMLIVMIGIDLILIGIDKISLIQHLCKNVDETTSNQQQRNLTTLGEKKESSQDDFSDIFSIEIFQVLVRTRM
jgi:hypothetical protein